MSRDPGCKCHREEGDSICPVHISDSELDDIQATLDGRFETTAEIVLGWLQRAVTVIRGERARLAAAEARAAAATERAERAEALLREARDHVGREPERGALYDDAILRDRIDAWLESLPTPAPKRGTGEGER